MIENITPDPSVSYDKFRDVTTTHAYIKMLKEDFGIAELWIGRSVDGEHVAPNIPCGADSGNCSFRVWSPKPDRDYSQLFFIGVDGEGDDFRFVIEAKRGYWRIYWDELVTISGAQTVEWDADYESGDIPQASLDAIAEYLALFE